MVQLWPCRTKNICTKLSSKNHMEQPENPFFGWVTEKCSTTKSRTTKDDDYPIIYKVFFIQAGAGFLNHQQHELGIPFTQLNRGISLDKSDTCWQQNPQDAIVTKWKFKKRDSQTWTCNNPDWWLESWVGGTPIQVIIYSWWFQSILQNMLVKLDHFPNWAWTLKKMKPPPRLVTSIILCS